MNLSLLESATPFIRGSSTRWISDIDQCHVARRAAKVSRAWPMRRRGAFGACCCCCCRWWRCGCQWWHGAAVCKRRAFHAPPLGGAPLGSTSFFGCNDLVHISAVDIAEFSYVREFELISFLYLVRYNHNVVWYESESVAPKCPIIRRDGLMLHM